MTSETGDKRYFWLDDWPVGGNAKGGYFVRNGLFKFIQQVEIQERKRVVGLIIDDSWNIEVLVET